MQYSLEKIIAAEKAKGYLVFEDDTKNYNLNLVGIRTADTRPDTFNDFLYMFWKFNGQWTIKEYPITTDPGLFYRNHPLNVNGTGVLKEMQHRGIWHIGKHQGKYDALVQAKPCTVIRDVDRDDYLNMKGPEETGMFGINCHGSKKDGESSVNFNWSAGCQVHKKWSNFQEMLTIARLSASNWGDSFTYTLLNQNDLS